VLAVENGSKEANAAANPPILLSGILFIGRGARFAGLGGAF
jgi:hypothetical protein